MYYGFFGLVWAFYSFYFVYSGGWDYYFTGAWTHETGQMDKLLGPGLYIGGFAVPIPKIVTAPLYLILCVLVSYGLWVLIERAYARIAAARGRPLSKARLRHQMLTVCAFLTFNLFYIFAGRPNILLMPGWVIKVIDFIFVLVSVTWLVRSLRRDPDLYNHERVARSLREQLKRLGFRSEEVLEGRALDQLSADEVYVLAKTLPNFNLAQKREAYRAILGEALEGGHARSAESLELLKELRAQLGLTEADHHAITESLGIQDPALLDPEVRGSVELRVRRDSYRRFLVDLVEQRCPAGVKSEEFLATAEAIEAAAPVRTLFAISDEDHARIVSEISGDEKRVIEKASGMLEKFRELEIIRFSLIVDPRPEALLIRHTLRLKERGLIREIVTIVTSITDLQTARSFAQSLYVLRGNDRDPPTDDLVERAPVEIRDAFIKLTADPVLWSYLDVIDALKPAGEVFVQLAGDRDPVVAALAISAIAGRNRADAERLASDLTARVKNSSPLTEDALATVRRGARSETIEKMAELLAAKVFTSLDLDSLAQIARQSSRVSFTAGEQICRFGDSPELDVCAGPGGNRSVC